MDTWTFLIHGLGHGHGHARTSRKVNKVISLPVSVDSLEDG